eukprot:gene10633-11785_t
MMLTILTFSILLLCSSALFVSPSSAPFHAPSLAPSPAPSVAPSLVPSVYSTPPPEPRHLVYTVAGSNKANDRGDGQPSQAGLLSQPRGLLTDTNGDIYIIEQHFIRKISFETGVMSTIVGGGSNDTDSGEHGVFYHANETYIPEGWDVAINDENGNIYFSDGERCCIRVFRPDLGTVLTAIGRCDQCGWNIDDSNNLTTALIHAKANLAFDNSSQTLYFADIYQSIIASVNIFDGDVNILLDGWSMGPSAISLGKIWYSKAFEGLVYVDNGNCQLGVLWKYYYSLLAGNPEGLCGVSNTTTTLYGYDAVFSNISVVTGDDEGNVYFQDMTQQGSIIYQMDPNSDLSRIAIASGTLTVGNLYEGSPAIGTILERSNGLAFHSATGSLLLSQSAKGEVWKMALNSSSGSAFQSVVGYVNGLSLPATSVMLSAITAMWLDHEGQSLYLSEPDHHRILVLDTNTQQIRVFAGNGSAGFNGDGEVASFTQLNSPNSIVGDGISHTLFIADSGNCRIRRVSLLGNPVVATLAGNGVDCGQFSDAFTGASPNLVAIYPPVALAVDDLSLTLYISTSENVIYAVYPDVDMLSVLGSVALPQVFVNIASLWWDPTGNLVISDAGLNEVFYLDVAAYLLTTIAGNGSAVEGGLLPSVKATEAYLPSPSSVCGNQAGDIFIVSSSSYRVLKLPAESGVLISYLGNGTAGFGGEHTEARSTQMNMGTACFYDTSSYSLYVADAVIGTALGGRVRRVNDNPSSQPTSQPSPQPSSEPSSEPSSVPSSRPATSTPDQFDQYVISTYAGMSTEYVTHTRGDGELAQYALLSNPYGVHVDLQNNCYVIEAQYVRKIDALTGIISTIVGGGNASLLTQEGLLGLNTYIVRGTGITGNSAGVIYYADGSDCRVRQYDPVTKVVTTVAGVSKQCSYNGDNMVGGQSWLNYPYGIHYYEARNELYIADSSNSLIRVVDLTTMIIRTFAGNRNNGLVADNVLANSSYLSLTYDVWVNTIGDVYIATSASRIRKVDGRTNAITTVAGNGQSGEATENVLANMSAIAFPYSVCGDDQGNIYFIDTGERTLHMVNSKGKMVTLSGSRIKAQRINGSPVGNFRYNYGYGATVDSKGNLLLIEMSLFTILNVSAPISSQSIVTCMVGYIAGMSMPSSRALVGAIKGMWIDPADGDVFMADSTRGYIHRLTNASESNGGMISVYAGSGSGLAASSITQLTAANIGSPNGIVGSVDGRYIYVTDALNGRIYRIDRTTELLLPLNIANGTATCSMMVNPVPVLNASFCALRGIALYEDYIFVQDSSMIKKIYDGKVVTIAGSVDSGYVDNVPLLSARFGVGVSSGLLADKSGNLLFLDSSNRLIRYADLGKNWMGTIAGNVNSTYTLAVEFRAKSAPVLGWSMCQSQDDDTLYILGRLPARVRAMRMGSAWIHSIAGNGTSLGGLLPPSINPDNVFASSTPVNQMGSCAVRENGDILFSETIISNAVYRIRRLSKYIPPTSRPTSSPSFYPSAKPSSLPSSLPSSEPSLDPSSRPSFRPSNRPSLLPSGQPSSSPSSLPSSQPSMKPSISPSAPFSSPSSPPSRPSPGPSSGPSAVPSTQPSTQPSSLPSTQPFSSPSSPPSRPSPGPSSGPSAVPSTQPSTQPSSLPSTQPFSSPSSPPSSQSSAAPSNTPLVSPVPQPSSQPSSSSFEPTSLPSSPPSPQPSPKPTSQPSSPASSRSSFHPSSLSSSQPSPRPSLLPSSQPLARSTSCPSSLPSSLPTDHPSAQPSPEPSLQPFAHASLQPSAKPSGQSKIDISVELASTTMVERDSYEAFATIMFSSNVSPLPRAQVELSISKVVSTTNVTVVEVMQSVLAPSVFNVSSSSLAISLVGLEQGSYLLKAVMKAGGTGTGVDASQFAIIYSNNNDSALSYVLFQVVSNETPLAAPSLLSVVYAPDGSYLLASFGGETNRGGLGEAKFGCSRLLSFSCVEKAVCQWQDDKTMKMYFSSLPSSVNQSQCALPGSQVKLSASAAVKAKCYSGCSTVSAWPNSSTTTLISIAAPSDKVSPQVVINSNDKIGSCVMLLLDLTASSGDGGRQWASSEVVVSRTPNVATLNNADQTSLEALQGYLSSSNYTLFPPTRIPSHFLDAGYTYSFQVTLCNFLGSCSSSTRSVEVVGDIIPLLSIPGGISRTMKRKEGLVIAAQASWPKCSDSIVTPSLLYTWSVKNVSSNQTLPDLVSQSKDPSKFSLPANTLQCCSSSYEVSVRVTAKQSPFTSSSSSVLLMMKQGDVVASISGSSVRNVRLGGVLFLDASSSYDEDRISASSSKNLRYVWSCIQRSPKASDVCSSLFADANFTSTRYSSQLTLQALSSPSIEGSKAEVTVAVEDLSGTRSAAASATVTLLPSLAPLLQVQSSPSISSGKKVNADQSFSLIAQISLPTSTFASASAGWSLQSDNSGVDLSSIVMAATNYSISGPWDATIATTTSPSFTFYLPLKTNLLPTEATLTFALTCTVKIQDQQASTSPASLTTYTSTSQISFTVNAAPRSGLFSIIPSSGQELTTLFSYSCSQWLDEDLPLSYQFGYFSIAGRQMILRSRLPTAYADLLLTAGEAVQGYKVMAVAQVFDALNSNATSFYELSVYELSSFSSSSSSSSSSSGMSDGMVSYLRNALNATATAASVDSVKQATTFSSYLLNKVNCTLAPNCSLLNRKSCFRTPQTCGPCLSSDYVGDDGDSNEACVSVASLNEDNSSTNSGDNASREMKSCPANCSGHGRCIYSSVISGESVSQCFAGDLSCTAYCLCEDDYMGSTSCRFTQEELSIKQALRRSVLEHLQDLTLVEDAESENLLSMSSQILSISQSAEELSPESSLHVLNVTSYLLESMQSSGMSSDGSSDLLEAVQSVLSASKLSSNTEQEKRRRRSRRLTDEVGNSSQQVLLRESQKVLEQYAQFVSNVMVPGQDAMEAVQASFRLKTVKPNTSPSSEQSNVTLSLPMTSTDRLVGKQESGSVTIPRNASSASSSSSYWSATIYSLEGSLFNNVMNGSTAAVKQSDPLSLTFSSFPCTDPSCRLELTLSRQAYYAVANASSAGGEEVERFNVSCKQDSYEVYPHRCRGTDQIYNVTCRGVEEVIESRCPVIAQEPVCSVLLGNQDAIDYGCVVVASTKDNITCSCPILPAKEQQEEQAVAYSGSVDGHHWKTTAGGGANATTATQDSVVSISYISLLRTVTSSFTSTVLSAGKLNDSSVAKGYRAILTLGIFAAVICVAMVYSYRADKEATQVKNSMLMKKKKAAASFPSLPMVLRSKESKASGTKTKKKKAISRAALTTAMNGPPAFLTMAKDALPAILHARSMTVVVKEEMKRHHRWLGVIFHYSAAFPRVLRVAALGTNIVIMLFMQSLTYNLTHGDDGSCERLTSESACLEPSSGFSTGESKCYWTSSSGTSSVGECKYVSPSDSLKVMLFVAVFSALVSTPIAFLADYLIGTILAAPTTSTTMSSSSSMKSRVTGVDNKSVGQDGSSITSRNNYSHSPVGSSKRLSAVAPSPSSALTTSPSTSSWEMGGLEDLAEDHFQSLVQALRNYLQQLSSEEDKKEFRKLWGLNEEGYFLEEKKSTSEIVLKKMRLLCSKRQQSLTLPSLEEQVRIAKKEEKEGIAGLLYDDLLTVQRDYQEEFLAFQSHALEMTAREKSQRLLYLFQRDLMPGISGQILENKNQRDAKKKVRHVSKRMKACTWLFLAALNVGMLFYIFLFAISQDSGRQSAWAQSFAMWLVADICLVSSGMVIVTHIAIPSFLTRDIAAIRKKLVDSLVRFNILLNHRRGGRKYSQAAESVGESEGIESEEKFNAASYLFVSHRLAQHCSKEVKVARVIAEYQTIWPRRSYQHVEDVAKSYNRRFTALTRSISMVALFFLTNLLTVPLAIQDMAIHMVATVMTGYTFLIHLQLFAIFPVLVIVPSLFVGVVIHFIVKGYQKQKEESWQDLLHRAEAEYVSKEGGKVEDVLKKEGKEEEEEGKKQEEGTWSGDDEERRVGKAERDRVNSECSSVGTMNSMMGYDVADVAEGHSQDGNNVEGEGLGNGLSSHQQKKMSVHAFVHMMRLRKAIKKQSAMGQTVDGGKSVSDEGSSKCEEKQDKMGADVIIPSRRSWKLRDIFEEEDDSSDSSEGSDDSQGEKEEEEEEDEEVALPLHAPVDVQGKSPPARSPVTKQQQKGYVSSSSALASLLSSSSSFSSTSSNSDEEDRAHLPVIFSDDSDSEEKGEDDMAISIRHPESSKRIS